MFIFHLMYHIKNIEATRPRYMRTRPKPMRPRPMPQNLASRPAWPRGLNIPGAMFSGVYML